MVLSAFVVTYRADDGGSKHLSNLGKLVNFYQITRRDNPEDSRLHILSRENFNLT
jgi:hypothetical protein